METVKWILIFSLAISILLCGCAGLGDWDTPLVGDYAIWCLSAHRIELVRERGNGTAEPVIEALVYQVAWNEDFICVQRTDPPETGETLPIVPEVDFYILRVGDGAVFGPYTATEYQKQCGELQITGLSHWVYAKELRPD